MARKKTNYKYHELPNWDKAECEVTRIFVDNQRVKMTLRRGENLYIMRVPKRMEWACVEEGETILVTKKPVSGIRAHLILDARLKRKPDLWKGELETKITSNMNLPFDETLIRVMWIDHDKKEMKIRWEKGYLLLRKQESVAWITVRKDDVLRVKKEYITNKDKMNPEIKNIVGAKLLILAKG